MIHDCGPVDFLRMQSVAFFLADPSMACVSLCVFAFVGLKNPGDILQVRKTSCCIWQMWLIEDSDTKY